jgi:hypothetical protein
VTLTAEGEVTRVSVYLTDRSVRALELTVRVTGDTRVDIINRALQVYAYLENARKDGYSFHRRESDDSPYEEVGFFSDADAVG